MMGDRPTPFEHRIDLGTIVTLIHQGTRVQVEVTQKSKDCQSFSGEVLGFIAREDIKTITRQLCSAGTKVNFRKENIEFQIN